MVFTYVNIQKQKLKKICECCICRRPITKTEEIAVCPDCQTIYHRTHLSIWLKIRKKCPICKNIIRNRYLHSYFDIKDHNSSISNDTSLNGVISSQSKYKGNNRISSIIGDSIILECPYCKNILESPINNVLSQCQICGAWISWINDLESKIKNLDTLYLYKTKKRKRSRLRRNKGQMDRKINYRHIQRQKEKEREYFREELQQQAQLESQNQKLLLNQDYLRRQSQQPNNIQYIPDEGMRIIAFVDKKENPRKINYCRLETIITLIMIIVIFIFVTIVLQLSLS